jgi:hypothetical protein
MAAHIVAAAKIHGAKTLQYQLLINPIPFPDLSLYLMRSSQQRLPPGSHIAPCALSGLQ